MPQAQPLRLTIKLDGPLVEQHRLPLSELGRVTRQFHIALQDVATVLSGYGPSGRTGRAKKFIEEATDLRVVAQPRAGSFELELEMPPEHPTQAGLPIDAGPALGEEAVRSFVAGLASLSDEAETLPRGFDPGVLKAIVPFRKSIKRGVAEITFTASNGTHASSEARVDAKRVDVAARLIKKPVRAHATAQGTLEMVDFKSLQCRIDRPPLPSVLCFFDERDRDTVQTAIRQFVRVRGEGQFEPGSTEPSKIWASSVEILYEALPFDVQAFWRPTKLRVAASEKRVPPFKSSDVDDDPWRDDDEAIRLIAAIAQEG